MVQRCLVLIDVVPVSALRETFLQSRNLDHLEREDKDHFKLSLSAKGFNFNCTFTTHQEKSASDVYKCLKIKLDFYISECAKHVL